MIAHEVSLSQMSDKIDRRGEEHNNADHQSSVGNPLPILNKYVVNLEI